MKKIIIATTILLSATSAFAARGVVELEDRTFINCSSRFQEVKNIQVENATPEEEEIKVIDKEITLAAVSF